MTYRIGTTDMADAPLPSVVVEEEGWIRKYWRPMMAWQYFAVCLCDFIIFPLVAVWYAHHGGSEWNYQPLTLKEGGFYHIAMGIIVGVSAWTRGEENVVRTRVFAKNNLDRVFTPPSSSPPVLSDDDCDDMYIDDAPQADRRPMVRRPMEW